MPRRGQARQAMQLDLAAACGNSGVDGNRVRPPLDTVDPRLGPPHCKRTGNGGHDPRLGPFPSQVEAEIFTRPVRRKVSIKTRTGALSNYRHTGQALLA